jgi:serine/threonine protein kinase/FixJ family two-component response regulator
VSEPALATEASARILVVDDNEDNRDMLTRRLKRKGYVASAAEDGESALEALESGVYDVVLLDVMMPGMSGIEVLEQIRTARNKTELPVIMATAKSDSTDVVDALKRGANDYVTKPIDFPVLLARIESQLSIKREAEERTGPVIDVAMGIEPGTVLDERYEILGAVGEGGFAIVYKARQLSTEQVVAFKHARPDRVRADEAGTELARFKREMQLIGKLKHPNIVRLVDSGSIPVKRPKSRLKRAEMTTKGSSGEEPTRIDPAIKRGDSAEGADSVSHTRKSPRDDSDPSLALAVPYIVMEFLDGESLGTVLKREGVLPSTQAVDLMLPVLSALRAAHQEGVVHRDVKPNNIVLARNLRGKLEPKVLDFGIAKLTAPDARALTVNESFIGTPEYMAPEQARGRKDVDPRADQFSCAAILYQAMTGRRLYEEDSFLALVSQVAHAEYTPFSEVAKDVPEGLIEVVDRGLSAKREGRYTTIEEFALALLPFASEPNSQRWHDDFRTGSGSSFDSLDSLSPENRVSIGPDGNAATEGETVEMSSEELGHGSADSDEQSVDERPADEPAEVAAAEQPSPFPVLWVALAVAAAAAAIAAIAL